MNFADKLKGTAEDLAGSIRDRPGETTGTDEVDDLGRQDRQDQARSGFRTADERPDERLSERLSDGASDVADRASDSFRRT